MQNLEERIVAHIRDFNGSERSYRAGRSEVVKEIIPLLEEIWNLIIDERYGGAEEKVINLLEELRSDGKYSNN